MIGREFLFILLNGGKYFTKGGGVQYREHSIMFYFCGCLRFLETSIQKNSNKLSVIASG